MNHPIDMFVPLGNVGSAIACAKGVVLPADFMTTGQQNPLPKAPPATAPGKTGEKSVLPWMIGAAAIGAAWWAWSSGALAGVVANPVPTKTRDQVWQALWQDPKYIRLHERKEVLGRQWNAADARKSPETAQLLKRFHAAIRRMVDYENAALKKAGYAYANPATVSKAASSEWEKAYREALRAGAKKGEAEEYAQEVLRAYQDDEHNRLGGALDQPEDYDYANPVTWPEGEEWRRIVKGAEELAARIDYQARQQNKIGGMEWAGRKRWARVYVQTSTGSKSAVYFIDKVTGNYYLSESWTKHKKHPSGNVKDLARSNSTNPGRAQKLGVHPSDVDPRELARGTKHELEHTDSRKVAARIALDHLSEDSSYYKHLDAMEKKYKGNPRYRTKTAFSRRGKWGWVTWTHQEPNKHAAIIAKGHELGAEGWDFGNADHHSVSDYPGGRGF